MEETGSGRRGDAVIAIVVICLLIITLVMMFAGKVIRCDGQARDDCRFRGGTILQEIK